MHDRKERIKSEQLKTVLPFNLSNIHAPYSVLDPRLAATISGAAFD
jgi:hypothetical protein